MQWCSYRHGMTLFQLKEQHLMHISSFHNRYQIYATGILLSPRRNASLGVIPWHTAIQSNLIAH